MALSLTIVPDTDIIDTFNNSTILLNKVHVITGTVEINVFRPVQIGQLYVQFHGSVESLVGVSDLEFDDKRAVFGDQVPVDQWETRDDDELSFVDRLSRKAFGQSLAILKLVDEQCVVLNKPRLFPKGKTSWPFQLTIQHIHLLPPSILTPHHKIAYHLLAKVKLTSLSERMRVTYWHACRHIMNNDTAIRMQQPLKHKRQILGASQKIVLGRHAYPNMQAVDELHCVRYRGARDQRIDYEISMKKFVCLQQRPVHFTCRFNSLIKDAKIMTLECHVEQTEIYPTKPGIFDGEDLIADKLNTRKRKFSRKKITMETYENNTDLNLMLPIDIPHISPPIHTHTLKISHKLRLIIKFQDETREKNMSLSFPLTVGSVPSMSTDHLGMRHERIEISQWNAIPCESAQQSHDLPTYIQVIREGMPPSPFVEDN